MFLLCYRSEDDRKRHLKSTQCYHISLWSIATSEVGMQSCFFFSYINMDKCEALKSSITQQQFLHLPLNYTGALPYYITFCFETTGYTVTQLKRPGGKNRWHTILMIEHESKKTFEHLLFICVLELVSQPEILRSQKICESHSNVNEQRYSGSHAGFKLWRQIKKPCGQSLQWKVARMLQGWRLTASKVKLPKDWQVAETQTNRFVWSQSEGHLDSQCGVWHRTKWHVRREEGRKREFITASLEQKSLGEEFFIHSKFSVHHGSTRKWKIWEKPKSGLDFPPWTPVQQLVRLKKTRQNAKQKKKYSRID